MQKNSTETGKQSAHETIELDELDRKILSYLQIDGKASLRGIKTYLEENEQFTTSISAIKNHINNLTDQGVIKDYIAVLDCCKIGYREMLLLFIKVNSSVSLKDTLSHLEAIDAINAIYQVSGSQPVFCMAKCVEKEDQIELLEQVKAVPGIEEINTQVVLQKIKEDMRVSIPNIK